LACLDQVQRQYSTNPNRVVLTGLSSGGFGTWKIGADYKNRFSALVPMCAPADFPDVSKLVGIPIWCFQNSGDFLVSASSAEQMCERIKQDGGDVKFTEYQEMGHDCWNRAYSDPALLEWMKSAHRPDQS
jgi:predicted peptidase